MRRMAALVRRLLGMKTSRELARDVLSEPAVEEARRIIRRGDRVLRELERTERAHRR